MKLPWDQRYLKISFHVIFTLIVVAAITTIMLHIVPIANEILSFFGRIFSLFTPFFIGVVIAYLLDPVVEMYQVKVIDRLSKNKKINKNKNKSKNRDKNKKESERTFATLLTYITVIVVLILVVFFSSRSIGNHKGFRNIEAISNTIEAYVQSFNVMVSNLQYGLHKIGFLQEGNQVIQRSTEALGNFVQAIGSKTVTFISGAGSRVLDTILALVIAFYLLKEKVGFTQFGNRILEAFIPSRFTRKLKYFWEDADRVLSGYIRGQLIDALIMGTLIGISLAIIGIDFPIMIGIIAGIFNLIPYFGPVVGIAAAALMGLVSDHPIRALYAAITLMVLQQIDGAIIVPKVVGESVDLHPVAVLLSIVIAGSLFGIIGMLLAVPVTALLKLLFERYMNERLNKQKESAS